MKAVFGRVAQNVAQNVGGIAKGVARFGEARAAFTATPDDEAEVELQLQRISDALMPEYRREATAQLKDLLVDNPKAQLAIGNMGIPVLVSVLKEDRDDLDLVRGALECLVCSMAQPQDQHTQPGQHNSQESQAGAINAELFARHPEHVQLLLNLLEQEPVGIDDFYVRYHTVQLLTLLLQACPVKLQDAIIASPMGVVRLCELLGEREVIRNEALQLLVALTKANEEVQKIAAFEGAFDRIFAICHEEGGANGGVVVQDSLELLNNLLRNNQANTRLFREMGFVPSLVQLIATAVPADTAPPETLPVSSNPGTDTAAGPAAALSAAAAAAVAAVSQGFAEHRQILPEKASILLCALESIVLLVTPPEGGSAVAAQPANGGTPAADGNHSSGQQADAHMHTALLQAGAVAALSSLCLHQGGVSSVAVRVQALQALAAVISGHSASQERLASSNVTATTTINALPAGQASQMQLGWSNSNTQQPGTAATIPALQAALRVCLHAPDTKERAAAEQLIKAYCYRNPDGQLSLIRSMASNANAMPARPGMLQQQSKACHTFGEELAAALNIGTGLPSSVQISARAALVLQHLLDNNPTAKQQLLTLPLLPTSPGAPQPEPMLPRCTKLVVTALRTGGEAGRTTATMMLRLLVVWLHECGPAAKALVDEASNIPLLVDLVLGKHPESCAPVSGLAAVLLGECLLPFPAGSPAPSASSTQQLLDVVLSRIGLSQYFARLDSLLTWPAFVAASQATKLPKPVTRASAAASVAEDHDFEHITPTQPHTGAAPNTQQPLEVVFDQSFTVLVKHLVDVIKQTTMTAFSKPSQAGHDIMVSQGNVQDVIAGLPGSNDTQKLTSAVEALRRAQQEAADLRARNRVLAEDLFKVSQGGQPTSNPQAGLLSNGTAPGSHMRNASYNSLAGATSAADVEARVAAEMRASKAEMEAATLRQQLDVMAGRLAQAERDAAAAREAAATAHLSATKHETDLQDLSAAYNSLENQAFQLETKVRELTAQLAKQQPAGGSAAGAGNAVTEQEIQRRIAAAVEAARKAQGADSQTGSGMSEEQVQARIAEAVAKAQEESAAEADEQMTDLLVCLGQEEQKVALLSDKLASYGIDVEALLATIRPEGEDEDELR